MIHKLHEPPSTKHRPHQLQNIVVSRTRRTFPKFNQMLGHKASRAKFPKTSISQSIFFDHNSLKLKKL